MASYRGGRARTSIAWEHFEIKDRVRSIATCNHCHENFSYRTTAGNLTKHLRVKHGFVKEDEINENADAADDKIDPKKALKGELWQHYEIKDEFLKLATCNLCHEPFSYQSSSVLVKHLQKQHDIECLVSSDEEQSDEDSNEEEHDASQNGTRDEERRRKSSKAWEFFEIKDPRKKIAACTVCGAKCSYRASVSNLTKHVRTQHGSEPFRSSSVDKSDGEQEASDVEENKDAKKALKGELWQHYEIKDEFFKLATCNLCHEPFSYQTCSGLVKHLQKKHDIECLVSSDEEQSDEDSNEEEHDASQNGTNDNADRRRNRPSKAWEFFEIKDSRKKIAACTVCGATCSYRASVSNLTKHVRTQHGSGPFRSSSVEKSDGEQEASDVEQNNPAPPKGTMARAQRSLLWLYFKCIDPVKRYSQCLICKKVFSHLTTTSNLKRHLARKHPDVKIPERDDGRKRILLSTGGELYEVETNSKLDDDGSLAHDDKSLAHDDESLAHDDDTQHDQTVEMDTVYLEDFDALDTTPPKKKRRPAKRVKTKSPEIETSSDDEIMLTNKFVKKKSDSLDYYAKYLASLLRKLPSETSNTLQVDFVKQIMAVLPSDAPITHTYPTVTDIFDHKGDKIN